MIHFGPWLFVLITLLILKLFPQSFNLLFILNIWGLSVPHTFSTFTRKDGRTNKEILKSLSVYLSFFFAILVTSHLYGMVVIYSFYFFWQQYHYSKQNFGIARQKADSKYFTYWLDQIFFLGTTVVAILCLFHGGSETFFGYQLKNIFRISLSESYAVPLNLSFLLMYLLLRRENYFLAISHVVLFTGAYTGHVPFAEGWLYLNVFHNAQYLIFMNVSEKKHHFLLYALGLTLALWFLSKFSLSGIMLNSFSLIIFLMLSLNFTHYIFDGIIWKRKPI